MHVHRNLIGKLERKKSFVSPSCRMEDTINMDLTHIGWRGGGRDAEAWVGFI
jgi:hypothetical protein